MRPAPPIRRTGKYNPGLSARARDDEKPRLPLSGILVELLQKLRRHLLQLFGLHTVGGGRPLGFRMESLDFGFGGLGLREEAWRLDGVRGSWLPCVG